MLYESEPQPGRESIQSKFDPASQIRMQEKNVVVQERAESCREGESGGGGRPEVWWKGRVLECQALEVVGVVGADQLDREGAVRYWVERHAVLKPRWAVPNRRGSNECPSDLQYI
jgi:hypothetical protein